MAICCTPACTSGLRIRYSCTATTVCNERTSSHRECRGAPRKTKLPKEISQLAKAKVSAKCQILQPGQFLALGKICLGRISRSLEAMVVIGFAHALQFFFSRMAAEAEVAPASPACLGVPPEANRIRKPV